MPLHERRPISKPIRELNDFEVAVRRDDIEYALELMGNAPATSIAQGFKATEVMKRLRATLEE